MAKATSKLAKELRKLRVDYDQTSRADMAKRLGIPDRELANIEFGKGEVTEAFIRSVVKHYAREGEEGDLFDRLKLAMIDSVLSVTFNMSGLTPEQRSRVIELKAEIDQENVVAIEKAKQEEKRLRERRASERAAKKAAKKSEPKPSELDQIEDLASKKVESKAQEISDGLSEDEMDILASLEADLA